MTDFNIRADAVDVERIMKQIRARIREKRGVDYTEEEIHALANVKLEKFLDPGKVRSDLLEQYRRTRASKPAPLPPATFLEPSPPNYGFEDNTVYGSSRGVGAIIRLIRRLLNPLLKLMINPNPIIQVLNRQSAINAHNAAQFDRVAERMNTETMTRQRRDQVRDELDALNYEVIHNVVVEMTRLGIEVKNLKMRVESVSSRLDFDERRARALEGAVQYRPGVVRPPAELSPSQPGDQPSPTQSGDGPRRRRRRRRGGRGRSGTPADARGESSVPGSPDPTDDGAPEGVGGAAESSPPPQGGTDDGTPQE